MDRGLRDRELLMGRKPRKEEAGSEAGEAEDRRWEALMTPRASESILDRTETDLGLLEGKER